MAEKHTARLASFVILERDGMIVLARRANTGYMDGMYQMPSGHIEAGEYPFEAAIREAKEEVGVDIAPQDLHLVHVSYCITQDIVPDYVDFFFTATKWTGEPFNAEPEKCDEIVWVSADALPSDTVPAVAEVMSYIARGMPFSHIGRAAAHRIV